MTKYFLLLILSLSACGSGKKQQMFEVPKYSYLIGTIKRDSKEISASYMWHERQGLKIKPCKVTMESEFNWDSMKTLGMVKSMNCISATSIDAILYSPDLELGIKPSYQGYVALKTEYDFEYPSNEIVKRLYGDGEIEIQEFLNLLIKEAS